MASYHFHFQPQQQQGVQREGELPPRSREAEPPPTFCNDQRMQQSYFAPMQPPTRHRPRRRMSILLPSAAEAGVEDELAQEEPEALLGLTAEELEALLELAAEEPEALHVSLRLRHMFHLFNIQHIASSNTCCRFNCTNFISACECSSFISACECSSFIIACECSSFSTACEYSSFSSACQCFACISPSSQFTFSPKTPTDTTTDHKPHLSTLPPSTSHPLHLHLPQTHFHLHRHQLL